MTCMETLKKLTYFPGIRNKGEFLIAIMIFTVIIIFKYDGIKLHLLPALNNTKTPQGHRPTTIDPSVYVRSRGNTTSRVYSSTIHGSKEKPLAQHDQSQSIVFVKTHKCASTVLQNIFLRYALSHDLNVLLPLKGHVFSERDFIINTETKPIVPLPKGQRYHILCNHVIFNHQEMKRFFPDSSTKYIGILRHPLDQLESALYYYGKLFHKSRYEEALKTEFPVRAFLNNPRLYDLNVPNRSYLNNRMSIDFGFPVIETFDMDKRNLSKISDFIKNIDKIFHLILVVELFDESIVLLKRLLHWGTEDILYFKLNVNSAQNSKNESRVFRTANELTHRKWAPVDYAFYEHARRQLEQRIQDGGKDFQRELQSFKAINSKVVGFCDTYMKSNKSKITVESTEWSKKFHVSTKQCDKMSNGEIGMIKKVRERQLEKYTNSSNSEASGDQ